MRSHAVPRPLVPEADGSCPMQALDELYGQAEPAIRRYVARRCRCPATVDDICAVVFEEAVRHARGGGHELTVGWLMTVAKRRMIDHWRREARAAALEVRLSSASASITVDPDVTDVAAADAMLEGLAPRHRAALVGRYVVGMPVADVAALLDTTYRGAESVLARARRDLRRRHEIALAS